MESPAKSSTLGKKVASRSRGDKHQHIITWRSILLGVILIPPNAYWIMYVEGIRESSFPTGIALFWNVMFTLFLLVGVNLALKRLVPRLALTQPEFAVLYAMLMISSALAGIDSLQLNIPAMSHPFWFATKENNWANMFWKYLPKWLTVRDLDVLKGFYHGQDSLYRPEVFFTWLKPVLWWCSFILALGTVGMCMTLIMRRQWVDNERLSFPLVQLPMAITENGGNVSFFKNRLLWIGIAVGALLNILNGLHYLYPSVPFIPVGYEHLDLGQFVTVLPWQAVGWTPVAFYPFIIAMGFFLPLDLSFSVWFFFLFRKIQQVLVAAYPIPSQPEMPFFSHQAFGAWFAYCMFAGWMARHHLKGVWKRIKGDPNGVDDSNEPLRYRAAFAGILLGSAYLVWFTYKAGMKPQFILPFFAIYFLLSLGITRMRAELGPPGHQMGGEMDAANVMISWVGAKSLGPSTVALVPLFWWFSGRGYRTNIIASQVESFKLVSQSHANPRRLVYAMIIAFAVGGLAAYWAGLHLQYRIGETPNGMVPRNWGQWLSLENRIANPCNPEPIAAGFQIGSALFTAWLFAMRLKFPWWPFHPVGYALCMTFGVDMFWSCILIAWVLKGLVMRWGGLSTYRRALPMAFGLIIGEYLVGAFWSLLSAATGMLLYNFAPGRGW